MTLEKLDRGKKRSVWQTLESYVRNSRNKVKSYITNKTDEASLLGREISSRREQRWIWKMTRILTRGSSAC